MARMPRLGVADCPHLLLQQVHEGQMLVRDGRDVATLLMTLREAAREERVAVHAYAVADDHLYLLATPSTDDGLSRLMQSVGRRYVAAFNRRHGRRGGLWSGRYRSTVVDAAQYLLECMVFIEQHALRSGAVQQAADDQRSSVGHHLGLRRDALIQDHSLFWALGNTPFDREAAWRKRMEQGLSATQVAALAEAAHKGWALGNEAFVRKVEAASGRRVQPKPRGRPRKPAAPGDQDAPKQG